MRRARSEDAGDRLGRLEHEVALPRHERLALLPATMTVRLEEPARRCAAEEELLEDAALDERGSPRRNALVVEEVVTIELGVADLHERRVVVEREERRHHDLLELLAEGLAVVVAAQAMRLQTMADDLVEEDARGASFEDGWAGERLGRHGAAQLLQTGDDLGDGGGDDRVGG